MNLLDTINIDDLLPDLLLPSPRTLLTAEDIQRLDAIQIAHDQSNESGECWICVRQTSLLGKIIIFFFFSH